MAFTKEPTSRVAGSVVIDALPINQISLSRRTADLYRILGEAWHDPRQQTRRLRISGKAEALAA